MNDLTSLLEPVSLFVKDLDLTDAGAAEQSLLKRFPPESEQVHELVGAAISALESGAICDREGEGVRFSRVLKPEADAGGCSVDAVLMADSKGPWHTHVAGEVCLCIPREGEPAFDGRRSTWMVLPVGSRHAPEVTAGTMLILYW